MDKYKNYMDSVAPSAGFLERLKELERPAKAPLWRKYAAMAAALVLVVGLGAMGMGRLLPRQEQGEPEIGLPEVQQPVVAPIPAPTLAPSGGGYEVSSGETVSYYMLPHIRYGISEEAGIMDMAPPVGVYRRDLTQEELLALLDGETNVVQHLNWGGYELSAIAMLNRDGSLWLLYVYGTKGDTGYEHFSLEIRPGELPLSCLVYAGGVTNEIWGTEVTAEAYDGEIASSRRLSFMQGDYGYRFSVTGADREAIADIAARTVRFFVLNCAPYFTSDHTGEAYTGEESTLPYDPSGSAAQFPEPMETVEPFPTPPAEE